jgi:hypothetical protein
MAEAQEGREPAALRGDEQMEFTDSVGRWMRTTTGVRTLEPDEPALDPTLPFREDVKQRSEAEDCGEGG